MHSLGSLREEDLDEIYIDTPSELRFKKVPSRSKGKSFNGSKESRKSSSPMGRRSYSHPEIHATPSLTLTPNELCFSCDIPQTTIDPTWTERPTVFAGATSLHYGQSLPLQHCTSFYSTLSEVQPIQSQRPLKIRITRYDPTTPEERVMSLKRLLANIYHENSTLNSTRDLTDSLTESFQSDVSASSPKRLTTESLMTFDEAKLRDEVAGLKKKIEQANHRLVRMVRQRAFYRAKQNTKCAVLSAILMATSAKTSADSKLRFSLEPPTVHEGVDEWKRAMRIMARLPGGIPDIFRNRLWSTLGELHILSAGLDWEQICRSSFSEQVQPDDIEIHSQILKDLHRTGWSGFDDEKKLKQVLLAYARYNKEIGYCQGFNVIAALILQVVEYRTDVALKVMIFLIEHVLPRGYFDQSLRALSVDMTVMKDLMLQRVPTTIEHLEYLKNSSGSEYEPPLPNIFSMHWFLTLFATCLPRDCVMRVWDALMLQGSEILLRTAIALWSKMSRKILRTSTADEFYSLMGKLCKELAEMDEEEQNHLMTVVYTMADFPYPGLAELREKYTWNIHPLSATFKLFRKSVTDILHEDDSDGEPSCSPCSGRRRKDAPTWSDLRELQKRYALIKQRQKQAKVIISTAYQNAQYARSNSSKLKAAIPILTPRLQPVFNHLLMGPLLARIDSTTEPPTTFSGGAVKVAATVIQPADHSLARLREIIHQNSIEDEIKTEDSVSTFSERSQTRIMSGDQNGSASSEEHDEVFEHSVTEMHIPFSRSQDPKNRRAQLRRSKTILRHAAPTPAFRPSIRMRAQKSF
ncbi:hypothetical protein RB195_000603 [Necator americanus]|uniref:Rab-GAP TBC domain-containing protein n=1 Tax=Necator americanus TaxID=51031 RepID=A0ABR1DAH7_NECAM